jgi:hypothetical protein
MVPRLLQSIAASEPWFTESISLRLEANLPLEVSWETLSCSESQVTKNAGISLRKTVCDGDQSRLQQRGTMKINKVAVGLFTAICLLALTARIAHPQVKAILSAVQVHMVITDQTFTDKGEIPVFTAQNVTVKQGENALKVNQVIPAKGDNAALQLLVLIDDTIDPRIGSNLNDIREFVNAQVASTAVGIAYMSNATFKITQNFTDDHALAAKGVRLPLGRLSAMDSPYLSLISLVKSWPQQKVRREVLMISDGMDPLRQHTIPSNFSTPGVPRGRTYSQTITRTSISPDADTASTICQRYGVIVHSIYATGAGRRGRNAWEAQLGQDGIAKITDETGGEYFSLGISDAVSFKPYLDRLQSIFANQYYLEFQAMPGKKDGLQRVDILTSAADADIAAADSVWVGTN